MALKITAVVGVTAAVLAISSTVATGAPMKHHRLAMIHAGRATRVTAAPEACYNQLSGDSGGLLSSEKFERGSIFNDRAADDFTLSERCTVQSIDVGGRYFDSGPLLNASIVLYRDDSGLPGRIIARRTVPAVKVTDNRGDLHVPLDQPVTLDPGTYWLGFRVRVPSEGGDWGWFYNQDPRGYPAVWKNPGGGYGRGCLTYQPVSNCEHALEQGLSFAVNPTP